MRLDKFLKISRLIKRRSVAKMQVKTIWLWLMKIAKPSKEIAVGDLIKLDMLKQLLF